MVFHIAPTSLTEYMEEMIEEIQSLEEHGGEV